jgi:hypothetical protein
VCAHHAGTARGGRPSSLDDATGERILQVLRAGGYDETAYTRAGVPKSTFYDWMGRGDPNGTDPRDQRYRRFRAEVQRARAQGEAGLLAAVNSAAPRNWQAAAWLLERRWPEKWARVSQRETDDKDTPPAKRDPFAEVDELAKRRNHQ